MESKLVIALLLAALFLITPTPVIDSVTPNSGLNNETVEVVIEGAQFDNKALVKLVKPGEADLVAADVKIISKEKIYCSFDLRGQAAGKWNVSVDNPTKIGKKKKSTILTKGFTIEYPAPQIEAVEPNTGLSSEILTLTITGANFRTGAGVRLSNNKSNIESSAINVRSESQVTAQFDLSGSTPGKYDLVVTNEDGKKGLLSAGFEILDRQLANPVIIRIEPFEGYNNQTIPVEIYGANFDPGSLVILRGAGGSEIPGFDIIVKTARGISCRFDLDQQPVGNYDVVVINSDGREAVLSAGFKIKNYLTNTQTYQNSINPIFFDFDKSEIRPDQIRVLEENLSRLIETDSYVLLGGHADERGPKEYNLGLSKRRAEAVQEFLLEKGFDPSKVTIYAYGEEYPVKKGHDEESWSYNRRVDFTVNEEPPNIEQGIVQQ
jgi:outer membrane protein OmpA-like peptidoglycan-associated protein